jgi:DNA-directed RNA polymerase specialized sigma24 family protein
MQYIKIIHRYAKNDLELISAGIDGYVKAFTKENKKNIKQSVWIIWHIRQSIYNCKRKRRRYVPLDPMMSISKKQSFHLVDILELCSSKEERIIVTLRYQGYNDEEIAKEMKCSKTSVFRVRKKLMKRFIQANLYYLT